MSESARRRLFSHKYDSVKQRELGGKGGFVHPYLGRLRLDMILSGQVVVTDAHLLDGHWLRKQEPERLLEHLDFLDDQPGLILRTRAPTLEQSAIGLLTDGAGNVKPLWFSSLPDGLARRIDEELRKRRDSSGPQSRAELDQLLRQTSGDDPQVAQLLRTWDRWVAYADRGEHLTSEQWDKPVAMAPAVVELLAEAGIAGKRSVGSVAEPWRSSDSVRPVAEWAEVRPRLVTQVLTRVVDEESRTDIYDFIDRSSGDGEAGQRLKILVDRVQGLAYRTQHRAADYEGDVVYKLQPVGKYMSRRRGERVTEDVLVHLANRGWSAIDLPSDYLARLALMATPDLREWFGICKPDLEAWWREEPHGLAALRRSLRSLEARLLKQTTAAQVRDIVGLAPRLTIRQRLQRHGDPEGVAPAFSWLIGPLNAALDIVEGVGALAKLTYDRMMVESTNAAIISTDIAARRRSS